LRFIDPVDTENQDANYMQNFEKDKESNEILFMPKDEAEGERYRQGVVQVVADNGLMNVFQRRANDDFWKSVSCIQTNVKAQIGCGTPILVHFYAPISHDKPLDQINYDFRKLGEDED